MNKPIVNLGYAQEVIDKCAEGTRFKACSDCACTPIECVDCQKEAAGINV